MSPDPSHSAGLAPTAADLLGAVSVTSMATILLSPQLLPGKEQQSSSKTRKIKLKEEFCPICQNKAYSATITIHTHSSVSNLSPYSINEVLCCYAGNLKSPLNLRKKEKYSLHTQRGCPAEEDNPFRNNCNCSWKENRNLLDRLPHHSQKF